MSDLDKLIAEHAHELHSKDGINVALALHALADIESGHGAHQLATRHEPAYCYTGFYYKGPNGGDLRNLSSLYGCLAHSSYSSWQIMYMVAYEEGFRGDPCLLRDDSIAIPVVIRALNRRVLDRYPRLTLEGLADAWNSGNPNDTNVPVDYIAKFLAAYNKRVEDDAH